MIKLIASLTMLIDHTGAYLIDVYWLRLIGRFSMPLFVHEVVRGTERTKDLQKYKTRLLEIAFVSQIPYAMLGGNRLNIIFNFLAVVLLDESIRLKKYFVSVLAITLSMFSDYGFLVIIVFLIFKKNELTDIKLKIPSKIYYVVYPLHLFIIYLIR